jgi:hypothetical protein
MVSKLKLLAQHTECFFPTLALLEEVFHDIAMGKNDGMARISTKNNKICNNTCFILFVLLLQPDQDE